MLLPSSCPLHYDLRWIHKQCELNTGNRDSILNLSELKKKIVSMDDIYLSFIMVHWSFILGQGWQLSNNFCKACQNSSSKFFFGSLLWKLPQIPSCSANNTNEYEWTVYQTKIEQLCYIAIMHWNKFCHIFLSILRNFEFKNSHCIIFFNVPNM